MSIQRTIERLKPFWHRITPLEGFEAIDEIESRVGYPLPADLKHFYQWFSNGGEGQLPGGYLQMFPAEEILGIQRQYRVREIGKALLFATDGDEGFAFDLTRGAASARYPVIQFSLASMDPEEVELVAEDFDSFLSSRLREDRKSVV